jgi:AraC family transcriptional regulator, transcriptional activator of pobA
VTGTGHAPAIRSLPFRHGAKPALGFELFKLSALFERAGRAQLGHALDAPQRLEFHIVYVGLRGAGQLVVDFAPVPLADDTVTVVARGRVQHFVQRAGPAAMDAWMLLFTPEFVDLPPSIRWPVDAAPAVVLPAAERAAIHAAIAELDAEQARPLDDWQPEILATVLRSILLRVERAVAGAGAAAPSTALRRFFTILERDHACTREVAHYAREAGLSPRRLAELLHAELGKSTKQVIDDRVILEHKRLLVHTAVTVKELAARTGFDEPTNLVKFFRHHTGQTPLEFRRAQAGAVRRNLPSGRRS